VGNPGWQAGNGNGVRHHGRRVRGAGRSVREDETAPRAGDAGWARAATAGDGNAIAALYASDATLLPPGEPAFHGEAATAGAKPLPVEEGKYIEVLKEQADGSWKIAYDIWSQKSPPAKP
jgi:ketosteroid isomerase-like protein